MRADIGGILFDLEGVLFIGDQVIEGASDTIRYVRDHKIPHRYVTNTTTQSRDALSRKLRDLGLPIEPAGIIPMDEHVASAVKLRKPVLSELRSARC